MRLSLDQAPCGHPANVSRAAACRIYPYKVQSTGVFLQGQMDGLGDKGRSFPEEWCPVLIKLIIEIDCNCRPV